jgi:hypothetical protein
MQKPGRFITDQWVSAHGSERDRAIHSEMQDCASGDSDGECGRLALLVGGSSIDEARDGWRSICAARAGLCFNSGSAKSSEVVDWLVEHRGLIATMAATGWCAMPVSGTATCALAQSAAFGFRAQQRGKKGLKTSGVDAAVTAVSIGLGSVFAGEAGVASTDIFVSLNELGYSDAQVRALRYLGLASLDGPTSTTCFLSHATKRGC